MGEPQHNDQHIVFILGAGASIPYGLPSGLDLLRRIQNINQGDQAFAEMILKAGASVGDLEAFKDAVSHCGRSSIDAFLEGRRDLVEVGRFAITARLIPFEKERRSFTSFQNRPMIRTTIGIDISSRGSADSTVRANQFISHRFSFITYNYDRSLEHFRFHAIKSSYGLQEEATIEIFSKIPIIHVHGRLGSPAMG